MRPPLVDQTPPIVLTLLVAIAGCLVLAWAVERAKRIKAEEQIAGHRAAAIYWTRRAGAWEHSRNDALIETHKLRTELNDLRDKFTEVAGFHEEWGDTNADELDRLDLWEELGRIINTGHRSRPAEPGEELPIPFLPIGGRS